MPVNQFRRPLLGRRVSDCVIRPASRAWLDSLGLATAADFLALPGVVVNGHVGRNVSRVDLGGEIAYLKREHRVRTRDRLRSWRSGFGWCSMSAREAAVLRRLEDYGVPVPQWLAFGSAAGQGFVLLAAASAEQDLRSLPAISIGLAGHIGRTVARIHAAGVDQPDLFAKHLLVDEPTGTLTVLDWQRARLRSSLSWARRVRTLAALGASAPADLFRPTRWRQVLAAYLEETATMRGPSVALDGLVQQVDHEVRKLLRRPAIREQRTSGIGVSQELIRIGGERVCAVPAVAEAFQDSATVDAVYDRANDGQTIRLPGGRTGRVRASRYVWPFGRWLAAIRGRSWRSPELRLARLLFHLERYAVPAPRLLAYGQIVPAVAPARSFIAFEPRPCRPPEAGEQGAVRGLLDRLHSAGCRLTGTGPAGEPFGMAEGQAVIRDATSLRLDRRLSRRQIRRDQRRVESYFRGRR